MAQDPTLTAKARLLVPAHFAGVASVLLYALVIVPVGVVGLAKG